MTKSISLLIVLAALGGCTTSSLVSGETTGSVYSATGRATNSTYIGPANRAYDCYYRGSNGGRYVAQCPMGYH